MPVFWRSGRRVMASSWKALNSPNSRGETSNTTSSATSPEQSTRAGLRIACCGYDVVRQASTFARCCRWGLWSRPAALSPLWTKGDAPRCAVHVRPLSPTRRGRQAAPPQVSFPAPLRHLNKCAASLVRIGTLCGQPSFAALPVKGGFRKSRSISKKPRK